MSPKKFLASSVAALAFVVLSMAPSFASGSFTWSAHLKCCINSRDWTQGGGSTTIVSFAGCEPNMAGQYRISLYKNQTFGDHNYGTVTYACGRTQQYTWTGLPSGTYHFHFSKVDDGIYIDANGSVSYP